MSGRPTPAVTERPRRAEGVRFGALAVFVAVAGLWNVIHWPLVAAVALPLAVASVIPALARRPAVWIVAFAAWVPFLVVGWGRLEDHVYVGAYMVLAVGIALTMPDPRESLARQSRLVVGGVFALAAAWKATSAAYLRGDVFRTVLLDDDRFDLLLRLTPWVDRGVVEADRATLDAFRNRLDLAADTAPLESLDQLSAIALGLTWWTLLIEVAIAVSFLASAGSRLARVRHPSLLAFGVTAYLVAPVLGFALIFMVAGLALAEDERVQACYVALGALPILRILADVL